MLRRNSGPSWSANQCFQFYVASPYQEASIYSTFWQSKPPECTSLTEGVEVGSCVVSSQDTLSIVFKSVSETAKSNQSIRLKITNFHTPFSSQILRAINVRGFSDALCQNGMRTVSMPSITIQQAITPPENVSLTSSSKTLGVQTSSNTLIVKFTPVTTMSPSGSGTIEIGVPYWYEIGNTGQRMYNPTAERRCSSDCMRIMTSGLVGDRIMITYESMLDSCIKDTEITINCRNFYNPITPELISGFSLNIYDSEIDSRVIEQTRGDLFFDARSYDPMIMPVNSFIIDPADNTISTSSTWTLSLSVNIPMEKVCYIRFFLPAEFTYNPIDMHASGIFIKPDLNPQLSIQDLSVIYRTADGSIPKSSVVFEGCNVESSLGKTPFGRIDLTEIKTQNAVKDSGTFEITIYKDKELTKVIAVLEDGNRLTAANVEPGHLSDMQIFPTDYRVQRVSDLTVAFKVGNQLEPGANAIVQLPFGLTVPDVVTATGTTKATTLEVIAPDGSTQIGVVNGNQITIPNIVAASGTALGSGKTVIVVIKGVKNQNSVKDAGDFTITTQNLIDGAYYVVDKSTKETSFVAVSGKVEASGPIKIDNPQNGASKALYSFRFTMEDGLPESGFIQIDFPPDVVLSPSTTRSSGSCRDYTCIQVDDKSVKLFFPDGLPKDTVHTLTVGGALNPRSYRPTGEFKITTYDIDGIHIIDEGYKIKIAMTIPALIESFAVEQSDFTNGVVNTYTFSLASQLPVVSSDKIQIVLPPEIKPPTTAAQMNCKPKENIKALTCSVIGQTLTAALDAFERGQDVLSWTVSGIRNSGSTRPTSDFSPSNIIDKDGFIVASVSGDPTTVTNRSPATLTNYFISQDSLKHSALTSYQINFSPVNALPSTASILITYPSSITMINGASTVCQVTTNDGKFLTNCVVNPSSRSIVIKNVFTNSPEYSGPISITLLQVKNPATNKPGSGFVIQTYADSQLTFIQDRLPDFLLQPQFECRYPCQDCVDFQNRNQCTACWSGIDDPNFLMFYPNGTQTCRPYCDSGYTTNGSPNLQCEACDPSCATCQDSRTVGDVKECTKCSETHPVRLSRTNTCLKECELGMFLSTNATCAFCKEPCEGCEGKDSSCTKCFQNTKLSNLFFDRCIETCPVGFVSVDGVCLKCESPCATCTGLPQNCDTCDGSGGTKFIYQQRCWAQCPAGSGPDPDRLTCFPCETGCDLCDISNKTACLKCTPPRVVFDGECLDECPEGMHINYPDGDGSACRPWKLGDLGILPFPFLLCLLIFTIICLLGLLKKRGYLHKGKAVIESPQRTLTCIIVAIAPLQFLATICQWIWAYIYGTNIFAILAAIVTLAAVIINLAFAISFKKKFNSKVLPRDIDRRLRLNKITSREAWKHRIPIDSQFHLYKKQNRCTVYSIFILQTCLNYKFNKALYTFFYDLKMFQVRFTNTAYYRKMLTTYHIVSVICIDLALICIDITCLTMIEDNNMLWITVIETLILSLLSIVLGSIELYMIKRSLEYTEVKKDKVKLDGIDSDDSLEEYRNPKFKWDKGKMTERRLLMDDLLKHVKHNRALFLNNKLDELLTQFGDRKCKSMLDLGTGWNLEDDPRMVITWPVSPMLREDYAEMGEIVFTKDDAYGAQGNNVYADVKSKFMGMDFGTQDDAGFLEFQDALNRKHGGLVSKQDDDLEERRIKRKKRRRGRKNKYYTQIDHEDDQEGEIAEATDAEEKLQVIKEQEEEEQELRNQVAEEAKKQQQAAQQRKKELEEAHLEKQRQELDEAEARKRKAFELECQARDEHEAEVEAARQAEIESKRLQAQYVEELKRKEVEDQLKREQAALASAKLRAEYEAQEAIRIKKEKEERERLRAESELRHQEQIQQDMATKQKIIDEKLQLQAEKDAQDLQHNKVRNQEEDRRLHEERDAMKRSAIERNSMLSPKLTEANETIRMADTLLNDFSSNQVDVPPRADLRTFNENDILGELDRDEKGNVVVLKDSTGALKDKDGNPTNERGYLVDPKTGSLVENLNHKKMFSATELDERGDLPQPFAHEKFNFNVHLLMGDFDYTKDLKPQLMQSSQGFYIDKKGRRVNKHGWMTLGGQGHLVDIHGRKKFDKSQLQSDGDLPKLFNYQGRRFDIKDVTAIFEKDASGKIMPHQNQKGELVDSFGRRCSEKGYLTDAAGNIIDNQGKQIWSKFELKAGEFPKIFPFSTFNLKRVMGDNEKTSSGNPMLFKAAGGGWVDHQKRPVNQRGYLIDQNGNVIDIRGNVVFDKVVLGKDGEVPPVYRTGVLKVSSNSDLSNLMDEIEKNDAGNSSMNSQMGDSPAKYDNANMRKIDNTGEQATLDLDDDAMNFASENESNVRKAKKKKPKKKITTVEILPPTARDKQTAEAYGGQAVGQIKRAGVKYDKDRLAGAQQFRVSTAEEPKLRAKLTKLMKSESGRHILESAGQAEGGRTARNNADEQPFPNRDGFMGKTIQNDSIHGGSQLSKKGPDSNAIKVKKPKGKVKPGMQDFEEIFGKDIDQFLEDSDWEMGSGEKASQGSYKGGSNNTKKLRQLEKQYRSGAK